MNLNELQTVKPKNAFEEWAKHRGYDFTANLDLSMFADMTLGDVLKEFCEFMKISTKSLEDEFAKREFEEYEKIKFGKVQ